MIEKHMATGYDLYNPFQTDQWVLDLKNGLAYHGTLKQLVNYMINNLGFKHKEILYALNEMAVVGDNAIHFGSLQTFIFSFDKNVEINKAS